MGDTRTSHRGHPDLPRGRNATSQPNGVKNERSTSGIDSAAAYSKTNRDSSAMAARRHCDHAPVSVERGRNCGRSGTDDCESGESEGAHTNANHGTSHTCVVWGLSGENGPLGSQWDRRRLVLRSLQNSFKSRLDPTARQPRLATPPGGHFMVAAISPLKAERSPDQSHPSGPGSLCPFAESPGAGFANRGFLRGVDIRSLVANQHPGSYYGCTGSTVAPPQLVYIKTKERRGPTPSEIQGHGALRRHRRAPQFSSENCA
jgi:hypothetical protein